MGFVVAVDLGGTKLATAVVDSEGRICSRRKTPVKHEGVEASAEQIAHAVREVAGGSPASWAEIQAVGLIVPGIYFAQTGNAWAPNLWGHDQVPLRPELEARLSLPVRIDSDRAGYVLGEQWLGAARGLKNVVFLAVGTGIGAGILADGRLVRGASDISGAVGWFALNPEWKTIYGQIGCWEAEAAGPGLARRTGASSAEEVVAAARGGGVEARKAVEDTAKYLGMGIANIVSTLNPEMVVLGGGLMQAADLFLEPIRRVVEQWAQPVAVKQVRIEPTTLGEDAGLLGATRLALSHEQV